MLRGRVPIMCLLALTASGCNELSKFRTHPNEAYSGEVIGSDSEDSKNSFIRAGFPSHTKMDLTFDPSLAAVSTSDDDAGRTEMTAAPGTIHTYVCPRAHPDCAANTGKAYLFSHARLERVTDLSHDSLSQYDFPGGGRLRNYMFFARADGDAAGSQPARAPMVFVSLMEDERVEVRVIAPSVLDSDGKTEIEPQLFGFFVLKRHAL